MTETSAGPPASEARSASRSTTPVAHRPAISLSRSRPNRPPAEHGGMLHRRHQQPLQWRRPGRRDQPGDSAITLASVAPEVKMTLAGSAPTSAATWRVPLDDLPRRPALGMDRRRITDQVERLDQGGARLAAATARSHSSRDRHAPSWIPCYRRGRPVPIVLAQGTRKLAFCPWPHGRNRPSHPNGTNPRGFSRWVDPYLEWF